MQYGMASQVMFSIAVVPMLLFFRRESETMGFIYTTLVLAGITGLWDTGIFFTRQKEYEKYEPDNKHLAPSNKLSVPEMVALVLKKQTSSCFNDVRILECIPGCFYHSDPCGILFQVYNTGMKHGCPPTLFHWG